MQPRVAMYLAPTTPSFWRWSRDGRAIAWQGGPTITFREELGWLLWRLSGEGLPPFDAVVLLMACCRRNWRASEMSGFLDFLVRELEPPGESPDWYVDPMGRYLARLVGEEIREGGRYTLADLVAAVVRGLDEVHRLVRARDGEIERVLEVANGLFEASSRRTSTVEAAEVVHALAAGFTREDITVASDPVNSGPLSAHVRFINAVVTLCRGLRSFLGTDLDLRERTGIDRLPAPADVDLAPAERVAALVSSLEDDRSLAPLARICRSAMAVTHIPRSLVDHDEMPTGGFSDIAARGTPDRLLPSELVHDDLTLALRIVLREALYFRRETATSAPRVSRVILLDCGIRLWGTSRILATAVGLAFGATAPREAEVRYVRHRSTGPELVDLSTRGGLVEHLSILETCAHGGASLRVLAGVDAGRPGAEAVVITSEAAYRDEEFRRHLAKAVPHGIHVATVDADGQYRLRFASARGRRLLAEARLDVEQVVAP